MPFRTATSAATAAIVLGMTTFAFANAEFVDTPSRKGVEVDFGGGDYNSFSENYDRTDRFDRADSDRDGMISRDEQKQYEFKRYDRDRDGNLDEEESGFMNTDYGVDDDFFGLDNQ